MNYRRTAVVKSTNISQLDGLIRDYSTKYRISCNLPSAGQWLARPNRIILRVTNHSDGTLDLDQFKVTVRGIDTSQSAFSGTFAGRITIDKPSLVEANDSEDIVLNLPPQSFSASYSSEFDRPASQYWVNTWDGVTFNDTSRLGEWRSENAAANGSSRTEGTWPLYIVEITIEHPRLPPPGYQQFLVGIQDIKRLSSDEVDLAHDDYLTVSYNIHESMDLFMDLYQPYPVGGRPSYGFEIRNPLDKEMLAGRLHLLTFDSSSGVAGSYSCTPLLLLRTALGAIRRLN
jgi:hypothetical protein